MLVATLRTFYVFEAGKGVQGIDSAIFTSGESLWTEIRVNLAIEGLRTYTSVSRFSVYLFRIPFNTNPSYPEAQCSRHVSVHAVMWNKASKKQM